MRRVYLVIGLFVLLTAAYVAPKFPLPERPGNQADFPKPANVDPDYFTHEISNRYFTRKPGMYAAYESKTSEGIYRKAFVVPGQTKTVMGVNTLVVRQREWLDDQLVQDTEDWFAQDRDGNVWYFGEAADNYEDGKLIDHAGSWEAGVGGATPAIVMPNAPKPGDAFHQANYSGGETGEKETVAAVGVSFRVPNGPFFSDCLIMRDWAPLVEWSPFEEWHAFEEKYYCVGVGVAVAEVEGGEALRLVAFSSGPRKSDAVVGEDGRLAAYSSH